MANTSQEISQEEPVAIATPLPLPDNHTAQFHLFSQLPSDIRVKIWMAIIPPEIVYIDRNMRLYGSRTRHPITLQINSESRSETLRVYKRCFSSIEVKGLLFNCLRDELHLGFGVNLLPEEGSSLSLREDLAQVQHIVSYNWCGASLREIKDAYPKLQTIAWPERRPGGYYPRSMHNSHFTISIHDRIDEELFAQRDYIRPEQKPMSCRVLIVSRSIEGGLWNAVLKFSNFIPVSPGNIDRLRDRTFTFRHL